MRIKHIRCDRMAKLVHDLKTSATNVWPFCKKGIHAALLAVVVWLVFSMADTIAKMIIHSQLDRTMLIIWLSVLLLYPCIAATSKWLTWFIPAKEMIAHVARRMANILARLCGVSIVGGIWIFWKYQNPLLLIGAAYLFVVAIFYDYYAEPPNQQ